MAPLSEFVDTVLENILNYLGTSIILFRSKRTMKLTTK